MPIDPFFLVGAGGHAKVVFDAVIRAGAPTNGMRVVDDNPALDGTIFLNTTVTPGGTAAVERADFHVAIGTARYRHLVHERLVAGGGVPRAVLHPDATLAVSAEVAQGAFIAARAIVGPDSRIGAGSVLNHGAIVDHDCVVGAFSHIAPNSTLGGGVTIGDGVLVGAGAIVLPGLRVGDGAVIAAGAVVVRDVPAGRTMVSPVVARARQGD